MKPAGQALQPPRPAATPQAPRWSSAQLFVGATVIEIEHQQQVYVLRQTAQGKLILTK